MEKWSKEKAWAWYNSYPWLRGFNYISYGCLGVLDMFQEYYWEENKKTFDQELKLAHDWGFNFIRTFVCFSLYVDQHDTYMKHLDEFLEICEKNHMYVMFTFGNDCCVVKENFSWPTYGPQTFDLGYHSGRKISPHITMHKAGFNLLDDPIYEEKFYKMVKEIATKYANDKRIIVWDIFNEPGNSLRGMMSYKAMSNLFDIVRSCNVIQPCAACCWSYNQDSLPDKEIELKALDMSDIILYHSYLKDEDTIKLDQYLKVTYDRPRFNTEWLHRIWNNTIGGLYPYYQKEKVGSLVWGFITGKSQTREPWEWLFDVYEKEHNESWDFSKWQHDLVRPNFRPYDYKEYKIIREINQIADNNESNK